MSGSWPKRIAGFGRSDLPYLAAPIIVSLLAAWARYGGEVLQPRQPGFLVLACGVAGGAAYLGFRRSGWPLAWILAVVVLLAFRVPPVWSDPPRMAWAGCAWSVVAGAFVAASLRLQRASRGLMGFGRFIPVAIAVGIGYVVAGILFGIVNRVETGGLSMRIHFAVGSLAGAAMGLGVELVEEFHARRSRRARIASTALLTAAVLGIVAGAAAAPSRETPRLVTYRARTMGTIGGITLPAADSTASFPLARDAQQDWQRVDSLMSNWTSTSEVARINRLAATETLTVHPEVAHVIDSAIRVWEEGAGAYDITVEPLVRLWGFLGGGRRVPGEEEVAEALSLVGCANVAFDASTRRIHFRQPGVAIDLGGIAKGYGVDQAASTLRGHGVEAALVDLSGNMAAIGAPPGRDAWVIGVRDPRDRIAYVARLRLRDDCIATSANYEQFIEKDGKRYGHILDPRTGWPVSDLLSATVLARTAEEADAWDTALLVLGPQRAVTMAKRNEDIRALLAVPGTAGVDTLYVEEPLRPIFELDESARGFFHIVFF
jgi:thiamine biosynthesis lipoprotein